MPDLTKMGRFFPWCQEAIVAYAMAVYYLPDDRDIVALETDQDEPAPAREQHDVKKPGRIRPLHDVPLAAWK